MRSQKQRNRAPRPFKTHQDKNGWSGGHRGDGFLTPAKALRLANKNGRKPNTDASAASASEPEATDAPPSPSLE